jgi:tetratricopeptide (TPR) repeat protein
MMAAVTTVAFFAILEGGLALFGVQPHRYASDPYVGFASTSPLFVEATAANGTPIWRTARDKWSLFNLQEFPRTKEVGVTRIFCVGGSTTFGRPYDDATSFCGWLRELLLEAAPDQPFEVINAGGVSYASYRVALLMEELSRHEPDAFVIYTGHNEFLERRTYQGIISIPRPIRGLGALASKTRTWAAVEKAIAPFHDSGAGAAPVEAPVLAKEVTTLLDQSVGPADYHRDDTLREQVLSHLGFNLARMVDIARAAGAVPMLVTPASNLRSCTPFKSEHTAGLRPDQVADWERLLREATQRFRAGDPAVAAEILGRAVEIDPRHAHTLYLWAQALDAAGQRDQAAAAYARARDEDICPLRALSEVAGLVRQVAADRAVTVVDFEKLARAISPDGTPGRNLFLDHVHPTIEGNRELALAIYGAMVDDGLVRPAKTLGDEAVARVTARVEGRLDLQDHAQALMKLSKVLGWAGKIAESDRLALQAVATYPDDAEVQYQAGLTAELSGRTADAMAHYARAAEIQPDADLPHLNLAVLLQKAGRLEEAVSHFRAAVENATRDSVDIAPGLLARALVELSYARYTAGKPADAVALLEEAQRYAPEDPEVLGRLGTARLAVGDAPGAVEVLTVARRVKPDDASFANRLAAAHALAGDMPAAQAAWRDALRLDPATAARPDAAPAMLEATGHADLARQLVGPGD